VISERQSLALATGLHGLLLAALVLIVPLARPLPPADQSLPVEVVDIADVPRVTEAPKPSQEAAPQETAAAEAPPPAPSPAAPAPVPDAVPPPQPAPQPAPQPKPAAKPALVKPAPSAKPLDTSALANLIDKALPKTRVKPLDVAKLAESINAAQPAAAKIDPRAAATLAQAIQAQVAPCWNPPTGGRDVRKMTVLVHVDYGRDGRVLGMPRVSQQTGLTAANQDYADAFRATAIRAVLRCQPLKLPAELYDLWKSVDINFDPELMT
jgi:outer membrane biosynthesis protein TonB